MAVTKIWNIRGKAGSPLEYIANPEKTQREFTESEKNTNFYYCREPYKITTEHKVKSIKGEYTGVEYAPSENSQMPPDFFLNPDDLTKDLLEVKAFNYKASPGFDIADFRMYEEEIIDKPYMLHVDYLIFGYEMSDDGIVTIKNVWLKKVWEITRRMAEWPINLQVKAGVVHKIRPGVWYSTNPGKFSMFRSMEHFLSAIEETVYQNPKTHDAGAMWRRNFLNHYQEFYGVRLNIPRWDEVVEEYGGANII